ncbi:hypothetical protein LZ198_09600 [Myxococcus sp. K15C18031901]|uniref:hypothetical protein n=1 Tax=Myxococcus dinghuensis TaxID=2906761 RepID=UPI0020A70F3B|nr:hypothetical protein [Myxococcus dinghuensis]MCP3099122.1 hypothetical protein [Myxococcus dinghuensis]
MEVRGCWRCQSDVPMLDEEEFEPVWALHVGARLGLGASRHGDVPVEGLEALFAPVCEAYTRLTGFAETNANAVMPHRLSLYGPPCAACGKPLRTPEARHCAACGAVR